MTIRALLSTPPPPVAVEIAPHHVAAIALGSRGARPVISAYASEPLPQGAVTPALNAPNIPDRTAVVHVMRRVFNRLGCRARRVALVVPDGVAKVSIVRFDQVPRSTSELEQLIRFQMRKAAPFNLQDAQVTFDRGARTPEGGQEFVVAVARRDLLDDYEQVCAQAGAQAGIVDLVTFNLINAVLAGRGSPSADWLLVHVGAGFSSIAIMRGTELIFFRNRVEESEGSLADLVHQTAMYYEDRLGGAGFARVILAGTANGASGRTGRSRLGEVRGGLERRLRVAVEAIDVNGLVGFADRIAVDATVSSAVAPLVGVLLRDRMRS